MSSIYLKMKEGKNSSSECVAQEGDVIWKYCLCWQYMMLMVVTRGQDSEDLPVFELGQDLNIRNSLEKAKVKR